MRRVAVDVGTTVRVNNVFVPRFFVKAESSCSPERCVGRTMRCGVPATRCGCDAFSPTRDMFVALDPNFNL